MPYNRKIRCNAHEGYIILIIVQKAGIMYFLEMKIKLHGKTKEKRLLKYIQNKVGNLQTFITGIINIMQQIFLMHFGL